jgi:DNA repair exonuclease SbcCD ATPase subunit
MIKIKSLTVKNFMSVGNQTQGVDFDNQRLTLVLGENLDQGGDDAGSRNGTGKTTLINALSYGLFGEALTKIRRENLVNKTNNKNMLVTLTFEKDGIKYRIERGRRPNTLRYFINDSEQEITDESQGDSRMTQAAINHMLGLSHSMFKHILALNTYTEPFLSMSASDQKDIIEQLLGITLLSEKAELLKDKIRVSKEDTAMENARLEGLKMSNEKIKETINSLSNKEKIWNTQKNLDIEKLKKSISELEAVNIEQELVSHQQLEEWTKFSNELKQLQKDKSSLEMTLLQSDKTVKKVGQDLDNLHDNSSCYACGQELHTDKFCEIQLKLEEEYGDAVNYNMSIVDEIAVIEEAVKLLGAQAQPQPPETFYSTIKEAYEHRQYLETYKTTLKNKELEQNPYVDQITELSTEALQELDWSEVNRLQTLKDHQEFLLKLLTNKDSFIRKKIIDQNLAFLNNRLTHYLTALGLPHTVIFKNDLSVEITLLGQDLDFDNLSRGERNRLILGLSFAFRDVWESLYQDINLLFIDELIDSGLDTAGVESSLAILKRMSRERGKSIYLISHKDELMGRVNNTLKVIKENGFTSYSNAVEVHEI